MEDPKAPTRASDQPEQGGTGPRKFAGGKLEAVRAFGTLGTIGFAFVIAVGLGVLIGLGLDRATGLAPLFLIIFFILGFAAGVVNVYRISRSAK